MRREQGLQEGRFVLAIVLFGVFLGFAMLLVALVAG